MPSRRTIIKSAAALAASPFVTPSFALSIKSSIITKTIPSSGQKIPVIGIGTNRYGVGDDLEAQAGLKATLVRFAEMGGQVIDTAQSYGSSEQVLGKLISDADIREQLFLSTKCDAGGGDATRDQLVDSAEELQSEVLDLVSIHNLRNWQAQLPILHEAKEAGKVRHVGITTSRNNQHKELIDILKSEEFDFVQLNYSLADRTAEQGLLEAAQEQNLAVMVNLPFARGKLFDMADGKELPEWTSEFDANSWAQVFLKYIVSHPAVTCAIPGTRSVKYIEDNFNAAMGRLPNADQRAEIEKIFA